MKLELEHLAPYLPYGLKFNTHYFPECNSFEITAMLTSEQIEYDDADSGFELLPFEDIEPILRPLSDYKDVNSKAMNELNIDIGSQINLSDLAMQHHNLSGTMHGTLDICFKNHIDVFGLIEKGLAVDINTIKTEGA